MFTDVVFANQHKMISILVLPLNVLRDNPLIYPVRLIEFLLYPLCLLYATMTLPSQSNNVHEHNKKMVFDTEKKGNKDTSDKQL